MHDGVVSPACVVVPVLSDPIQEGHFAGLDDVGETREAVPTRGCGLEERFMLGGYHVLGDQIVHSGEEGVKALGVVQGPLREAP